MASSQGDAVPPWLKSLPLAPEFRPTLAEFADPIAYLLKIEPAAAPFGVCKIVPPLPPPPKRATLGNLSRSFAALHPDDPTPTFPTRHQQLGLCPRRPRPALKPVWLSPHGYTLPKFEAKAGASRKALLARLGVPPAPGPASSASSRQQQQQLAPLDVEALFWRAAADRPVVVEYASDMPGSGFPPCAAAARTGVPAANLGETAWNMRGVARSPASLLRFVREEVPGVTSPMLYVGMMFSWFAWHVEDHELHSLNYMHYGAPKTWYAVPRDAALAFEEVVRVHGYGGEVNSLETFAMLGNKTTVMSPEVLVSSGIPCCRLVQNAGEFVVTFPGAYHCGFSHGFNCGEASNIATPEWLRVAKEAAVRRASINCPPLVSHYQLLYEHALSMCSRDPSNGAMEPRSCRLKEKKKSEGDQMIKKIFVQNVIEDNKLLDHFLSDGSPCIVLPVNSNDGSALSTLVSKFQSTTNPMIPHGQCGKTEAPKDSRCLPMKGALGKNGEFSSSNEIPLSVCSRKTVSPTTCIRDCANVSGSSYTHNAESDKGDINSAAGLLDHGLLSCVTCGILSFSCVAVIKPRVCAAKWLMTTDSSLINDRLASSGEHHMINALQGGKTTGGILRSDSEINGSRIISDVDAAPLNSQSALDLLASAYGDPSDSDEDDLNKMSQVSNELRNHTIESQPNTSNNGDCDGTNVSSSSKEHQQGPTSQSSKCIGNSNTSIGPKGVRTRNKDLLKMVLSEGFQPKDIYSETHKKVQCEPSSSNRTSTENPCGTDYHAGNNSATICMDGNRGSTTIVNNLAISVVKPDKDSSRMHVFCLEHAIEVKKQLQAIGGADIFLLCRPEYPRIEVEARLLAEEMEFEYDWKDIVFKEATIEDREKIHEVVQDEEAIPTNSDWAVKLGINLYYSANLAKSPLYNKQVPYNRVIYEAFGCGSPNDSPIKVKTCSRRQGRVKKIVLAGRWCGKVWMSNQVHPYLAERIKNHEPEEINETCSDDQKSNAEPFEDLSREAASRRKSSSTAVEGKTRRREKEPLEKANAKKPKFTEDDNSKSLDGTAETSTQKIKSRTVLEKTSKKEKEHVEKAYTKNLKQTEKVTAEAFKGPSEASFPAPAGMVVRSSSRIANRKNMWKSKMEEEDNGSANRPKSKVGDDKDDPAGRSRAKLLREKTKVAAKKKTKETRAEKRKAPSPASQKDEEEQPYDIDGCSITKEQLSLLKKGAKIEEKQQMNKSRYKGRAPPSSPKRNEEYVCDIEGCSMSFGTKQALSLHKNDICPEKGCCRKFFSHKYLLQHRKVHIDDRPLKCSWKGCSMAFKWPWARTEHMRVHTGDRPYVCPEPDCGQTFRFVSDFSRHKRKTGHAAKKAKAKK